MLKSVSHMIEWFDDLVLEVLKSRFRVENLTFEDHDRDIKERSDCTICGKHSPQKLKDYPECCEYLSKDEKARLREIGGYGGIRNLVP